MKQKEETVDLVLLENKNIRALFMNFYKPLYLTAKKSKKSVFFYFFYRFYLTQYLDCGIVKSRLIVKATKSNRPAGWSVNPIER